MCRLLAHRLNLEVILLTKFQKLQKWLSVIPFWSTFFITFVTMIVLKKEKAPGKLWFFFMLTFFISGIVVYLVNAFLMTGQHIILNLIVSGLLLAVTNFLFVDIQVMSKQAGESFSRH